MPGFETSENISKRSASCIVCLISGSIEAFWHLNRIDINIRLVIVLTKAAPSFFVKCLFFSPFFWLFNRFGYLNQSGKFHIKISTFHYTRCFH